MEGVITYGKEKTCTDVGGNVERHRISKAWNEAYLGKIMAQYWQ